MKNGTVLAIISDTHVGSSTALAPLEFTVHNRSDDERQVTKANKLQTWLYECWTDYWNYVFKLSKKKRLIVVHVGDLIDGVHNQSTQLMPEVEDQMLSCFRFDETNCGKSGWLFWYTWNWSSRWTR